MRSSLLSGLLLFLAAAPALAADVPPELSAARGILRYQQGELGKAVPLLRAALRGNPEHLAAAHHLGLALARLGQLEEGRRVLRGAARLAPQDARLQLDLGLIYLAEGNAVWAVRALSRAHELAPRSWAAAHYLGIAYLAMDEPAEAAAALRAARKLKGGPRQESDLQLALALFRARELDRSRAVLSPLLLGERGELARRLMRATHDAGGLPSGFLSGSLAAGGLVDENPLYEHDAQGDPVFGLSLAGSLTLRPWIDRFNRVEGRVGVARTFYFPADTGGGSPTASDVAATALSTVAGYSRVLTSGPDLWTLGASYSFDLVFLDGFNELFEDGTPPVADDHHIFLERHAGHLTLERRAADGGATRVTYSVARETFAHFPRSNLGLELSLEHGLSVLSDRLRLLFWLYGRYRMADRDYYTALAYGQGVGGSLLLPLDLVLGLRGAYEHQRFPHSEGGPWKELREDHQIQLAVELGRTLPLGFRVWASYQRDWRPSTVASFDIRRHLGSVNVSWSYQ